MFPLRNKSWSTAAALFLTVSLGGCAAPLAQPGLVSPSASNETASPREVPTPLFSYTEQACDPEDPRIAASGLEIPTGNRPEARVAAACLALEWLSQPASASTVVEIVRSPSVHELWEAPNRKGLEAMERLIGSRFLPVGAPIKLLLVGDAMEWGCTYGRREIDPYIPRPAPWTEEWLGCSAQRWPCGGSNIELSSGVRFLFSACPNMDLSRPPNGNEVARSLRGGHELVHILQSQLSRRFGFGPVQGFDWAQEGIPIYFDAAAAWLAGYDGDWRLLEDRSPYAVWRTANPEQELSIRLVSRMDPSVADTLQAQLRWLLGSLATEYLVAHWGIGAPWAFYSTSFSPGESFSVRAFGITEEELTRRIDGYLRSELEQAEAP